MRGIHVTKGRNKRGWKQLNKTYKKIIISCWLLYNCDIEIIDNTEKSEQQELVEDLVQIITVFSCKLQGKRANKARKLVKELIEEGGEDNGKNDSSNASSKQ